jgi:integrase
VRLALQTGLRFGELTGLRWHDVDLTRRIVTVVAVNAKSGKTRHVPLNDGAVRILKTWRTSDVTPTGYVFPGAAGERLIDVKTAWMPLLRVAGVTGFRFHDLRHTFASRLVMAGVDLNTVRELLGHADLKMTLRYAHLAPDHKAAAVAKLPPTTRMSEQRMPPANPGAFN